MTKKTYMHYFLRFTSLLLTLTLIVIVTTNQKGNCNIFTRLYSGDKDSSSFRLTDIVCSYVEKLYVYPDKINPKEMVTNALKRLEKAIPELLVNFDEKSDITTINVDDKSISLEMKDIQTLKQTSHALKKAFTFISENKQSEKIKADDIMYEGLNGMLTKLDPHTVVLPPKDFDEFKIGTTGKFGGLGMVVGIREGILTVISPIEGTPAEKAGLKAGDQIIEIDDESTVNMTLSESVGKLRGDPDTYVTIAVKKYKSATQLELSIQRKIIKIPTVTDKVLEDGIGYIKIRNFQNDTSEALNEHIKNLRKDNSKIKGMIIDLRNNSGGLLDQAIKVTDQFIDSGNIVVTVGPGGRNKDIQKAKRSELDELDFPIVLLINSSSASGAEIVVGALKENNRGIVIGNRSFGKGSVQQLIDLIDGAALKLTMAKYLTPLFNEVNTKGITPDIFFTPAIITEDNIDLYKEHTYIREEDLLDHENTKGSKNVTDNSNGPVREIKYLLEIEEKSDDEEKEDPEFSEEDPYKAGDLSKDTLVQFAKMFIKNTEMSERNAILKSIDPILKEVEEAEQSKILAALKDIGIDWSSGQHAGIPKPLVAVSFKLDTDKTTEAKKSTIKTVNAGEKLNITISISNNGTGTMYQTRGITESENMYFNNLEFFFGKIGNGETKSYTKTIEIPKSAINREDKMAIKFHEMNGYAPDDIKNTIHINSMKKPVFAYSFSIADKGLNGKTGNNDGRIQENEDISLCLIIKNIGEGISEKTSVALKNISDDAAFVRKGIEDIGTLEAGETKTVNMEFKVKENLPSDEFNMDIIIRESTFGSFILSNQTFKLEKDQIKPILPETPFKLTTIKDNTPVYGVMWEDAEQISALSNNTLVKTDGKNNGFYHIELAPDNYGWIPENYLKKGEFKDQTATEEINYIMQHMPPAIDINMQNINLLSDLDKFILTGNVTDDKEVKNIYAFVNNEKVYYKSKHIERHAKLNGESFTKNNDQKLNQKVLKDINFSINIHLKDGINTVAIIARDNEGLTATKSFVVTKTESPKVEEEKLSSM